MEGITTSLFVQMFSQMAPFFLDVIAKGVERGDTGVGSGENQMTTQEWLITRGWKRVQFANEPYYQDPLEPISLFPEPAAAEIEANRGSREKGSRHMAV